MRKKGTPEGLEYILCVGGHVEPEWFDWPYDLEAHQAFNEDGQRAVTVIKTSVPDQPALHAMLQVVANLNLKLIYVVLLDEAPEFFTDLYRNPF